MADMNVGASDFLQAYQTQISKLEADPNATQSFKEGLERQLKAVKDQLAGQPATPLPEPQVQTIPADPAKVPPPKLDVAKDTSANVVRQQNGDAGQQSGGGVPDELKQFAPQILEAARITGQSPALLSAQIWQESRGQSGANAGLMQVDAATFTDLQKQHPELQGKSLSDPLTNILAGSFYFQDLKKKFGSDDLALRAYNSGPGSVDPSNADTTTTGLGDPTYVQKVMSMAQKIEQGVALPA